jgi:hypothetical protein
MLKSEVFPSTYAKAADLKGQELTATISFMTMEEIGTAKDRKPVLYFEDAKPLVLNHVNWDRLEYAYGDSDSWPGQKVTLFTELVSLQGKSVPGIRLKPVVTKRVAKPATKDDFGDDLSI